MKDLNTKDRSWSDLDQMLLGQPISSGWLFFNNIAYYVKLFFSDK
jgi:hypothetical protein